MNPFSWSFRAQFLAGFFICVALLAFALYSQYQLGLNPCPLCTFQRGAFVLLAAVFLIGALHSPRGAGGRRAYGLLALLAAALGTMVAGRHVWLQHLPADKVPACGPDLSYMMEAFPFADVLRKVFTGSGECAVVDWTFLGLSMPEWSLAWFLALLAWALFAVCRPRKLQA
jgi:protein dithiol:quinone oxidoreductase